MTPAKCLFPLFPAALVVLFWVVILVAIPPARQDFPLNDDWAYSKGVFAFARGEGIHYYRQGSMPLLGQWLLCYPVIRAMGENHAVLRLITVAFSLVGTLAFYDLLRSEGWYSAYKASFAAGILALNPIYFLLSGTYMSDVPAFALSLAALASYTRALQNGRRRWLLTGTLLATLAVISRQNAIVTPIAAGFLLSRDRNLRSSPIWLFAITLPVAAGVYASIWFTGRPDAIALGPTYPTAKSAFVLVFAGVLYLGLSTLPMLALRPGVSASKRFVIALIAMANGVWICMAFGTAIFPPHANHGGLFPYLENMVTPWGTLESGNYIVGERPLMMGWGTQMLLTLAGCAGGAALVDRAVGPIYKSVLRSPLILYSVFHTLLLLVSPTFYDRYLIVLLPGALAIAGAAPFRPCWPAGLAVLALFAACSVGLMHDWLAWNSARWDLGRRALARGIPAADIEGGLEWDSWYAPKPVALEVRALSPRGLMLPFNRNRFPHITGRYALAFPRSLPRDSVVLDSQSYRLWLVPGAWRLVLITQRRSDR